MTRLEHGNPNPEAESLGTESKDIYDINPTDVENSDQFLMDFTSLPVEKLTRSGGGGKNIASLTVVNSQKGHGNRVGFSDALFNALGKPHSLKFSMNGSTLAIASDLPGIEEEFIFRKPEVYILYNKALVLSIAKAFDLDYSNGRTSYSFRDIEIKNIRDKSGKMIPVALVSMNVM